MKGERLIKIASKYIAHYGQRFNLDHWKISLEVGEIPDSMCGGQVEVLEDSKVAIMTLDQLKFTTDRAVKEVVKHEMVHILLSPLERLETTLAAIDNPLVEPLVGSTNEQLAVLLCEIL